VYEKSFRDTAAMTISSNEGVRHTFEARPLAKPFKNTSSIWRPPPRPPQFFFFQPRICGTPAAIFSIARAKYLPRAPAPWVVLERRKKTEFQLGVEVADPSGLWTGVGLCLFSGARKDMLCYVLKERGESAFFSGTAQRGDWSGNTYDRDLHPGHFFGTNRSGSIGYQDFVVFAIGHLFFKKPAVFWADRLISNFGGRGQSRATRLACQKPCCWRRHTPDILQRANLHSKVAAVSPPSRIPVSR